MDSKYSISYFSIIIIEKCFNRSIITKAFKLVHFKINYPNINIYLLPMPTIIFTHILGRFYLYSIVIINYFIKAIN